MYDRPFTTTLKITLTLIIVTLLASLPLFTAFIGMNAAAPTSGGLDAHDLGLGSTSRSSTPSWAGGAAAKAPWWERTALDADRNGIDDALDRALAQFSHFSGYGADAEAEADDGRVPILIAYDRPPTDTDLEALERLGVVPHSVFSYVDGVSAREVPLATVPSIAALPHVVMVEEQSIYEPALDVAASALRARDSAVYPDTVWTDLGYTGAGVVVAVLDTGVDENHESLVDKYIGGADFSYPVVATGNPSDSDGHGSHCAGIIAGTGGAQGDYRGIAPDASLCDVKVLDSFGPSYADQVIDGVEWCIEHKDEYGIDIMSMSLGGRVNSDGTGLECETVNTAIENGLVAVVAVGNDGTAGYIPSPAAADDAITVGSVYDYGTVDRADDAHEQYSNTGPRLDDGDADARDELKPDLCAPGTSIMSVQANTHATYVGKSGTSMAAPMVSGVVALMLDANPSLSPAAIKRILHDTAEARGSAHNASLDQKYSTAYGWGIVDAYGAVKRAADLIALAIDAPNTTGGGREMSVQSSIPFTDTAYSTGADHLTFQMRIPSSFGEPMNISVECANTIDHEIAILEPENNLGDWVVQGSITFTGTVTSATTVQPMLRFQTITPRTALTRNYEFDATATLNDANATAAEHTITVTAQTEEEPDFAVTRDDITFDPEDPTVGETVLISAEINNSGTAPGVAVVAFYDGPANTGEEIGTDTVDIPTGEMRVAQTQWTATAGTHTITVAVDPDDTVNETSELNNQASRTLIVSGGSNLPPHAVLNVEPQEPVVDQEVQFDASLSWDPDGDVAFYYFDFGDGTNTGWTAESIVTHIYYSAGDYEASLQVQDNGGANSTNEATEQITVRGGEDLDVFLDAGEQLSLVLPGTELRADCPNGFTPVGPGGVIGTVEWREVGLWKMEWPETMTVKDRIRFRAWLDNTGTEDLENIQLEFTLLQNGSEMVAPTESERISIASGDPAVAVALSADIPQTELKYRDLLAMKVRVKSNSDDLDLIYGTEEYMSGFGTVALPHKNELPVVDAGDAVTIIEGETVEFFGTASDPDGELVAVKWDFEGDGVNLWEGEELRAVEYRYTTPGTYYAKLTVTDDDGGRSSDTRRVRVMEEPPNKIPYVTILSPANMSSVQEVVEFRGTAYDDDGTVQYVELRIDERPWLHAEGGEEWVLEWNSRRVENGVHNVTARAYDGEAYSDAVTIRIAVDNINHEPAFIWFKARPADIVNDGSATVHFSAKIVDDDGVDDIRAVAVNLSLLGGLTEQPMYDDGTGGDESANDNIYSYELAVPATVAAGPLTVEAWTVDRSGALTTDTVSITVYQVNEAPRIRSTKLNPTSIPNDGVTQTRITIEVEDPNGLDDLHSVTIDLAPLGHQGEEPMYDDGGAVDEIAGDGVFTITTSAKRTVPAGEKTLTITVTDRAGETASQTLTLELTASEEDTTDEAEEGDDTDEDAALPGFGLSVTLVALAGISAAVVSTSHYRKRRSS